MSKKPNPLYIPIPRKIHEGLEKRWDIVRRCNGSRRKMVDFICGIGGYSADRYNNFAIEFDVSTSGADVSVENLWKLLTSKKMDVGPDPDLPPEHMAQAKALFWRVYKEHEEHVWEWGAEEAYEGWKDSDTPYETWLGERVDWEFGLYGRGGKHLCMESCEGINLKKTTEALEESLMERSEDEGHYLVPAEDLRKLFIICVQNSVELTSEAASQEVEYRAAWRLWVSFCEEEPLKEAIADYENREHLSESAGLFLDYLSGKFVVPDGGLTAHELAEFKAICKLADIAIEGE